LKDDTTMATWTAEPYRASARVGRSETEYGDGLNGWLLRTFDRLRAELEARRRYRETVRELSRLSDRELDDIGIGRWEIRPLAERTIRARGRA
jgi:uncharacterized protein YjiS (DUF1127 family)